MAGNGDISGMQDKDYDILHFTEQCLSNTVRLQTYAQDAERGGDAELASFFRKACAESQKGAEQGRKMLKQRIAA